MSLSDEKSFVFPDSNSVSIILIISSFSDKIVISNMKNYQFKSSGLDTSKNTSNFLRIFINYQLYVTFEFQ